MENDINTLIITNMYPDQSSQKGIFVKEFYDTYIENCSKNCNVINIDRKSKLKYVLPTFDIIRAILKNELDIINVQYGLTFLPLLFLLPMIFFRKIKIVTTLHGSDVMGSKLVNFLSNFGCVFSSSIIIVSKEMKCYLWPINKNKSIVFPCGVKNSFKYKQRNSWNRKYDLNIIFPSNPERVEKNYKLFKSVVHILLENNIRVNEIIFVNLNREQVHTAYYNANLLFLSSLREGSPQVVKEALFTGLPIVSTDVGDVQEILDGVEPDKKLISDDAQKIAFWIMNNFFGGSVKKSCVDNKVRNYSLKQLTYKQYLHFKKVSGKKI